MCSITKITFSCDILHKNISNTNVQSENFNPLFPPVLFFLKKMLRVYRQ